MTKLISTSNLFRKIIIFYYLFRKIISYYLFRKVIIVNSYLYVKFISTLESKYQLLIIGGEKVGVKKLKNPKVFIDYSQTVDDIYENLEDYNPKKRKLLIVFDDMIADMEGNKN